MKRIEYDKDIVKHFVRHYGWLAAVRERKSLVNAAIAAGERESTLSYFTFCASSAVDVFMLEQANLVRRDRKTDRLRGVYFCESDPNEFMKIAGLIGSQEAGFQERFEEFVLFQDDKHTLGKVDHDPALAIPNASEVRRKFTCKKMHQRFLDLHPFDVINLDLYGNLFPPKGDVFSRMFETIEKVFEMQKRPSPVDDHSVDGFTLFLTIHVCKEDFNAHVVDQLRDTANDNFTQHPTLKSTFSGRFAHEDADRLMAEDFPTFFSIIWPKVVAGLAKDHGWFGRHKNIYLYGREHHKKYHMMSSVAHYERLPQKLNLPGPKRDREYHKLYLPEITSIFHSMPLDVDLRIQNDPATSDLVAAHLAKTIAFRQKRIAALSE